MACCGTGAKWKREVVHDHKFDFIDVNTFYDNSLLKKLKYSMIFLLTLKSTLVYIADLWTAGILLFFNNWQSVQPKIPLEIARYIYMLCILCSFLLLGWDAIKSRKIIRSRDIGLAYTSPLAYRTYVLRSYAHYCFFSQINNSKKISDDVAFFVFFTLKGWKRILFAEAPRQVVNGFTIFAILTDNPTKTIDFMAVYSKADLERNPIPFLALFLMAFVCVIFAVSVFFTLVASILYVPLLCHIRGNLKEYCCHKIDKRIGEMLKKKSRKRLAKEAKREMARALKEQATGTTLQPVPTLPVVDAEDTHSEYELSQYEYASNYNYAPPFMPAEDFRNSPRIGPMTRQVSVSTFNGGNMQRHMSQMTSVPGGRYADDMYSEVGHYYHENERYREGPYQHYAQSEYRGSPRLGPVDPNYYPEPRRNGSITSAAGSAVGARPFQSPRMPPYRSRGNY